MNQLVSLAHTMALTNKVTNSNICAQTFDQMLIFVKSTPVVASTEAFLQTFLFRCVIWNRFPPVMFNTPMFLAMYLLAVYPDVVIKFKKDECKELVQVSQRLMKLFGRVTKTLLLPLANSTKEKFLKKLSKDFYTTLFTDYTPKFKAWKAIDEIRLVERIQREVWMRMWTVVAITGNN